MITLNRKVRFSHPDITYSVTNYTEYLFGSIGLKVNADIRVDIEWNTTDVNMYFDSVADTITRRDGGLASFLMDGFRIGDTITIINTVSNNISTTILDISSDGSIMYVAALSATETATSATIHGITPIISMDFYPNCIENNTAFSLLNLTDRETMPKYYADTITTDAANPTIMTVGSNSKGWVTPHDSATIYRLSFTGYVQTFVISHTFDITPVYIAGQLTNLQHGLAPASTSYKDRFSLKYVFTIDGKFTAFDPTIVHTTDGNVEFPKGQTGWFNEFINGRPTVWTKESILYTNNATGAALTAVDYCKTVDVVAILQSQVSGETSFKVQVMYLPINEDRYVNTLTNWKTNFIYERAVVAPGGGAVQGENTGDYSFLKNVTATSLTGNRTRINFQVDFSTFLTDFFDTIDSDNLNYLIFITAQHTTNSTTILSIDQTAVIMDTNVYQCDTDDATLFQIIDEWQFFEYPHCSGSGYSNFSLLPRDTVVAKGQFHVKQGTALDQILLQKISVSIVAVKQNDVEEFNLETFSINTGSVLPNCDNIQEIDFDQSRDFILPDGDCRKDIRMFRMPTLDIAGYSAYELIYPFRVRWEDWRKLQGANRCFPNPTQNWMVYANQPGWAIKFAINAEVESQRSIAGLGAVVRIVNTTSFEHITWGTIKDPCDFPYAVEFNTLNTTGLVNYEEVIGKDVNTFIEATATGDFSGYTVDQLYGILSLDAWSVGGVSYTQEIGTRIVCNDEDSWYGAGSTYLATITKVSNNTVKVSAFLDYTKLPTDTNQFILSLRVGYYQASASSSGATCLNEIMLTSFTCGELEIEKVNSANVIVVSGQAVTSEDRNVFLDSLILTYVAAVPGGAAAYWTVSGGRIDGFPIASGTIAGTIIAYPAHPYTDANVGNTIQGAVTGTVRSSITEINGIGDMQIGCTFFVS